MRYEAYKDSGVDWIGEIPEHWEMLPLRAIFDERNEKNDGPKTDFILSVTKDRGVIPYDEKGAVGNNKSEDIERYKLVYRGDFVINKMNVIIGSLGMSNYFGAFSQVYLVYKPKSTNINLNFYAFIFSNSSFYKSLIRYCTGIMELRESLNKEEFKKILLPFPQHSEQTRIAEFLDDKTAKIDQTIAIRQKEIELLKERRQIQIQQAVTKGLDATVPMKDSGVDWIGEIPEHWEVRKLKYNTSKIGSGVTPSGGATTYLEEGIPLLRSQNIYFEKIELENVAYISQRTHNEMSNSKVKKDDILLNITGGSIGRCNIYKFSFEANVNQHVCIVRPKNINPNYLNLLLSSSLGQFQIFFQQQGGGREGLNFQNLKNFYFPISPLEEQIQIVSYLEKIEEKISKAIMLKEQEIEKLKEYKTVLIDNVVTGKVKID